MNEFKVGDWVLIKNKINIVQISKFYSYIRKVKSVNRVYFYDFKTKMGSSRVLSAIERHAKPEEIKAGRRL